MNSVDMANDLIDRARNLRKFEVKRMLEDGIMFNGPVPFDIRGQDDCFWIYAYAMTQEEAEAKVDNWLNGLYLDD
jgi:hypothetical protein